MSGVAADIRFDGTPSRHRIEAMLARLVHRGAPRVVAAGSFGWLGEADARRRPDESGHAQDNTVIVFDGELTDRREAEAAVGSPPTTSDAALVLSTWNRLGVLGLRLIHGRFAFVLWDGQQVVLGRDRLGEKPLFFRRSASQLRAASETFALFADGLDPPRVCERSLALALVEEPSVPGETLIEDSRAVPPGHVVLFDGTTTTSHCYWALDPATRTPVAALEAAASLVEEALSESIRDALRHEAQVSVWISGGLDSTTIAALAKKEADVLGKPAPLLATTGYDDLPCDETRSAEQVARHLGLELVRVPVPRQPNAYDLAGPPDAFFFPFGPVWMEMGKRLAERGVSAHLMGIGSDETQWRTGFECESAMGESRLWSAAAHAGLHAAPWSWRGWKRLAKAALRIAYPSERRERAGKPRWGETSFIPEWVSPRSATLIQEGRAARRRSLRRYESTDIGRELRFQWLAGGAAGPRMLEHVDLLAAGAGLAIKNPFLDVRVATLLLSLPGSVVNPGRLSKPVLRAIARRHLPVAIAERPLKTTTHSFLAHVLSLRDGALRSVASGSRLERMGLLVPGTVAQLRMQNREGTVDRVSELTTLVGLEAWLEAWGFP